MKLDTNLKPQDKRTIAIVLYIAIVVLFSWYMIRPAILKTVELDDKIKAAEITKQENKMKKMQLSSAEILYNKAVTDINTSTKDFYDVMDNSQIEKMGTKYILGYGLTPVNFVVDIRDGSYIVEAPYKFANLKKAKVTATPVPTKKATSKKQTTKSATSMSALDVKSLQAYYNQAIAEVTTTKPAEVQCARIKIVIQGPQEKCQKLIDDILKKPSIRVTGFAWHDVKEVWGEDEKGEKILMNADYKELTLNLYFYMTAKPDFDKQEG